MSPNRFRILTICPFLFLFSWGYTQQFLSDSFVLVVKKEILGAKNVKKAYEQFVAHRNPVRYDDSLFYEIMEHYLFSGQPEFANQLLHYNPFLIAQHNQQALFYYFKGIAQMLDERGWPFFKEAEKCLNTAASELSRSSAADYGFYSDVENARGYLSVVARGACTDPDGENVCIIRPDFMYDAVGHFRTALVYNPDNSIAQRNLDTVIAKLQRAGLPIPPSSFVEKIPLRKQVRLDSTLNVDSLNNLATMPVLDYDLLPVDHPLILRQLHRYDEVILLIDLSGSMDDPVAWSREASKFHIAHQLALYIAMNLRKHVLLGALSVGQSCDTKSMVLDYGIGSVSRNTLIEEIAGIIPEGWTPLNQRLLRTKEMFSARRNRKLVFLVSDGMDTCGENPDLCGTAAVLAANGIDLSIFSFINETLAPESRSAYSIYTCMVHPSGGKIYKVSEEGDLDEEIDYVPVSNNILVLPALDSSALWRDHRVLYQFSIEGVEPPVEKIIKKTGKNSLTLENRNSTVVGKQQPE